MCLINHINLTLTSGFILDNNQEELTSCHQMMPGTSLPASLSPLSCGCPAGCTCRGRGWIPLYTAAAIFASSTLLQPDFVRHTIEGNSHCDKFGGSKYSWWQAGSISEILFKIAKKKQHRDRQTKQMIPQRLNLKLDRNTDKSDEDMKCRWRDGGGAPQKRSW